jgi:hypothetical protein
MVVGAGTLVAPAERPIGLGPRLLGAARPFVSIPSGLLEIMSLEVVLLAIMVADESPGL